RTTSAELRRTCKGVQIVACVGLRGSCDTFKCVAGELWCRNLQVCFRSCSHSFFLHLASCHSSRFDCLTRKQCAYLITQSKEVSHKVWLPIDRLGFHVQYVVFQL